MTNQQDTIYRDRVLKGDTNAFSYFVDTYQQLAFTIAVRIVKNREEAEDIVQEAFIKCYHSLASFKGDAKFSTWLYKIVYHSTLDRVRKNARQIPSEEIEKINYNLIDDVEDALDILEKKEREKIIGAAIETLTNEEQTIITLYYYEDLSLKEIATIVGISTGNVKIKLFRARKQLFEILRCRIELVNKLQ
ncbi:RNA polymerase sigma factor [Galbibacter pacificus]|uniref:RNA polymerase sigma factor n=1 Tax=Galbibacter pacificus TaxID=2996052 RepID=A0ABT6FUF0_9FLAO|nr:RNA polymerase sigma factor [Galbibacter pacificus]MDG3583632.1 RNA polymerase sigma factor [Galbibacter pacificus]MDG3586892.1 RNA polymerase sigma factor [Galbibacter pacificus]